MRKREIAKKGRIFIKVGIFYFSFFSKKSLQRKYNRAKYIIGYYGLFKRYCIVKNLAKSCGDVVAIYDNVTMNYIENMDIGNDVAFNTGSYIEAYGGITFGDHIGIAQGVSVFSVNHNYVNGGMLIGDQGLVAAQVTIGNDVWIGSKATILMGVNVSTGSVIGAGAVVTEDTPPYSVSVGVPAKVIGVRK